MKEFSIISCPDSVSCMLKLSLENVELMKFGNTLVEAEKNEWLPYQADYKWQFPVDSCEARRFVFGFFLLKNGALLILKAWEPPNFLRWQPLIL